MKVGAFLLPALGQTLPAATLYFIPEYTSLAFVASGIVWGLFGLLLAGLIQRAGRITVITDAEGKILAIHPPAARRRVARGTA